MTALSKVGNPHIYEDGDQRTSPRNHQVPERLLEVGPERSYIDFDPHDSRSLADKLGSTREHGSLNQDNAKTVTDPLAPARAHGNEPSKGAKIDAELQAEEQEALKNKRRA